MDVLIMTDTVYIIIYFESRLSVRHAILISSPFVQYIMYESFEREKKDRKKSNIYFMMRRHNGRC